MATCSHCGKEYDALRKNQRFCGDKCRKRNNKPGNTKSLRYSDNVEKWTPRPQPVLITDAEQKKIDHEVFAKSYVKLEYRLIQPGHPDFDKIAATLTPLDKIPKERYHFHRFHRDGCYHFMKEEG